jgi:hypothetical protein
MPVGKNDVLICSFSKSPETIDTDSLAELSVDDSEIFFRQRVLWTLADFAAGANLPPDPLARSRATHGVIRCAPRRAT